MDMKSYLEGVIERCDASLAELEKQNEEAQTADEARSIGAQIVKAQTEKAEAQRAMDALGAEKVEERGLNPMATFGMKKVESRGEDEDVRSSMEYRKAFMDYVQNGVKSDILMRANVESVTEDLGILLPNTIIQRIMLDVEKVYGQIYGKVRKVNVKGGVQYPMGQFTNLKMYWDGTDGTDTEHGVSPEQKTGEITGTINFTYHIGEVRIAQSLLMSILTVQAFEDEVVKTFVGTYVRTMDELILTGNGVNQPEGILTELAKPNSRIAADRVITINAEEMRDWKTWQKKLFAKIPLSMRKLRPEFLMTVETFESNILTMVDDNNNPIAQSTIGATVADTSGTFKSRLVTFVEEGAIKSFDSAQKGDVIAIYWVPQESYLINFNQQFSYRKFFDEYKNKWVTKGLVVCDGKILDPKYIWIIKKG